ncbi:MAG: orotate phosphoribosyltransferase [Desulfobacula sp.]|uniref:orotate phosphoribosyltransferase n=1 Tax=Desulfobacula sp. TaxID=2593537 RepID=UPI0025BFF5D2|nr:orotate phosphoribosyltransferase [Desulfobacula sp.]MCD4720119.1 orotate phosphoribosyltransferase [Desulfobacula sp.]
MTYKEEFIEFLIKCNALKFGEFELKSGRIAPYFINTGMFDTGLKIKKLGTFYAKAIQEHFSGDFDGIYGPAYKGIPLCICAAMALSDMGMDKGYVFNRKEAKTYADKSLVVGMPLTSETRLILVDDVITSGKAIRESLEILKSCNHPKVSGIIISVNRQEKGKTDKNALKEVEETLCIPIQSIVTITDIKKFLHNKEINGKIILDDPMLAKINAYLKEYGAG